LQLGYQRRGSRDARSHGKDRVGDDQGVGPGDHGEREQTRPEQAGKGLDPPGARGNAGDDARCLIHRERGIGRPPGDGRGNRVAVLIQCPGGERHGLTDFDLGLWRIVDLQPDNAAFFGQIAAARHQQNWQQKSPTAHSVSEAGLLRAIF
jgi:hypothetical protein